MTSNVSDLKALTVSEPGDLSAAPGSQPWAIAVRLQVQSLLKNSAIDVQTLRTWLKQMEEYAGYRQLTDEKGEPFSSYTAFCKAKQPWGLDYSLEAINKMLKESESDETQIIEVEEKERNFGQPEQYLRRFSKLVEKCKDNQLIDARKIAEVLDTALNNAHIWRQRWLDLGWIERSPQQKRGYYQITDEGLKQLKDWSEQSSLQDYGTLWITIPRNNVKKAAEQLIKSLDSDSLRELNKLIEESLAQDSDKTQGADV